MQTDINTAGQPHGFAGQTQGDTYDITGVSEESSAEIEFGSGVRTGTLERGVLKPSSAGQKVVGVVKHTHSHHTGDAGDLGTTGLLPDAKFLLVRKGRIKLKLDAGVSSVTPYSDRGWLRHTSDAGSNIVTGRWGKAADGSNNLDCTGQVLFVGNVATDPDGTKSALAEVDFTNEP